METIVVDTSVIIKWFAQKDETDVIQALKLLGEARQQRLRLVEPGLVLYELVNVLKIGKNYSLRDLRESVAQFMKLQLELIEVDEKLVKSVTKMVNNYSITSYDAAFIAVAELKKIPLVTADDRHHQKVFSKYIVPLKEFKFVADGGVIRGNGV